MDAIYYAVFAVKIVLILLTVWMTYLVRKNWLQNKAVTFYVTILLAFSILLQTYEFVLYFVQPPRKLGLFVSLMVNAFMGYIVVIEMEILKIFSVLSAILAINRIKVMQYAVAVVYVLCHFGAFLYFDDNLAQEPIVSD
jgi:hypothetical protein